MIYRRWDVLTTFTGTANSDGSLHFITDDIYIRAGEVMVVISTYTNRYDFLKVEMYPVDGGHTVFNLPWRYDGVMEGTWTNTYGYETVDAEYLYRLEITGKYTDEIIRRLDAGMTVEEDLGYGYDYQIRIFIPETTG